MTHGPDRPGPLERRRVSFAASKLIGAYSLSPPIGPAVQLRLSAAIRPFKSSPPSRSRHPIYGRRGLAAGSVQPATPFAKCKRPPRRSWPVRNATLGFGCEPAHARGGSRVDPTRATGRELFSFDVMRLALYEGLRTKIFGVDQGGISHGYTSVLLLSYNSSLRMRPTSGRFSRARALVLIHPIHPALPNPRSSFKIVGVDRKM